MENKETEEWIPALSIGINSYPDMIKPGDQIRLYGKETTVTGFYAAFNSRMGKWGTIILTTGRGDPFERSLNAIEVRS